ncbi:PepSY1/2 domain-containing protein [Gracilibacillus sp. JCM 18860]|uniref:PepSY1/2 domain-containing protein n=1 Tax=Gracilibacillus sp. JCM 18860 TaxID=1306159 RepID=UPI000AEDB0CE
MIQVKVALDNGDILGLVAKDYFENHRDREIHSPKITEEEARKEVNPNLKIHENHLAIIEDDLGEEVLAYVFLGTLGNDSYKIFINAESGDEERVEKLKQAEIRY